MHVHACMFFPTISNQFLRRPHRPRDPNIRGVFKTAGINLPGVILFSVNFVCAMTENPWLGLESEDEGSSDTENAGSTSASDSGSA